MIFDAMDLFLGAVGVVTLALGAIGIINIMLVSVTERTREIGVAQGPGRHNRSILTQFFFEGMFLTVLSGSIGVAGCCLPSDDAVAERPVHRRGSIRRESCRSRRF